MNLQSVRRWRFAAVGKLSLVGFNEAPHMRCGVKRLLTMASPPPEAQITNALKEDCSALYSASLEVQQHQMA